MNQPQVIVVGAGISGLACAMRLHELGVNVRVLEAADRAGGLICTARENGFLFESGPQSFQLTTDLRALVRAAGCESQLIEANPSLPRYVLRRGKLRLAPMSPPSLLTSPLLSARAKLRIATEPFRRSQPRTDDESFADFVRRRFGTEILEYLAGPFVSGIFAGDPEKLSLRSAFPSLAVWESEYGSIIRGAMKSRGSGERVRSTLASFQAGMSTLLDAMVCKLQPEIATGMTVNSIESSGPNLWRISCSDGSQSEPLSGSAIVLATPAYTSAKILQRVSESIALALSSIPYAPVVVVSHGYRREHVGHVLNGFGFLIPRTEKLRTLGVIWNSSLFPNRCPEGTVLMTSFIGGASDPHILDLGDTEISSLVHSEVAPVLKISAPPIAERIWRHKLALPQYNLGHAQKIAAIRENLATLHGIFIAGNYLDGPSIGSCVSQAFHTAESVRDYLAAKAKVESAAN
jgi:protoporphyrinogen/coproporphyrinogen III oxidase